MCLLAARASAILVGFAKLPAAVAGDGDDSATARSWPQVSDETVLSVVEDSSQYELLFFDSGITNSMLMTSRTTPNAPTPRIFPNFTSVFELLVKVTDAQKNVRMT